MHTPIPLVALSASQVARFNRQIDKSGDCWLWLDYHDENGRARFKYNGHRFMAARVADFLARGIDPADNYVLHTCDNPSCVRPTHLWHGTQADNVADMVAKGRHGRTGAAGTKQPKAKLDEDKVLFILESGMTQDELRLLLGVSQSLISMVKTNKVWKHVKRRNAHLPR